MSEHRTKIQSDVNKMNNDEQEKQTILTESKIQVPTQKSMTMRSN